MGYSPPPLEHEWGRSPPIIALSRAAAGDLLLMLTCAILMTSSHSEGPGSCRERALLLARAEAAGCTAVRAASVSAWRPWVRAVHSQAHER